MSYVMVHCGAEVPCEKSASSKIAADLMPQFFFLCQQCSLIAYIPSNRVLAFTVTAGAARKLNSFISHVAVWH